MSEALAVLCLNAGSSSLKFALWQLGPGSAEQRLVSGAVSALGTPQAELVLQEGERERCRRQLPDADLGSALPTLFALWDELQLPRPGAVGHRVVHGGPDHAAPAAIDAALLAELRDLTPLAPLHMPSAILGIELARAHYRELLHVACFDTAFHRALPERARRLPLPRALFDRGLRRYGFHGLSFEYVRSQLGAALAPGRSVVAHLGSGSSLVALRDGQPVDTSMGFSPTGGVMMGTRSGDLDPGVLMYLESQLGYDARSVEQLLNQTSGLLGVSGISADVKRLLELRGHEEAAAEALEMFCYTLQKQVGAYSAALGGIDTLVFTGGIGEHSAELRGRICRDLGFLGVALDTDANRRHAERIDSAAGSCRVYVVKTDEQRMIARHTHSVRLAMPRTA